MPRPRHLHDDPVPAPRRARRSGRQRAVLAALGALFALCVVGLTVVGYALVQLNSIDRYDDLEVDAAAAGEPENYLVVGSDSRAGGTPGEAASVEGRRSDTIMVVRIDPREEAAAVLSLPRDLVVPIAPSGEEGRINTAYASGTPEEGRQWLIDTIRQNFGISINHYVEIDFQGFGRLVDAVGGVPLYFEAAVRDRSSGLYQTDLGCVTLNGEQALAFVRSRHLQYMTPEGEWEADPTGDLGRITRQQVFLREALSNVMGDVSNPLRLRELVDIGVDSVGLDGEMGLGDIFDLADRFRDFDPAQLQTHALPIEENGDGATVSVDTAAAEPVLNIFRGLDPGEISPAAVHVQVLNGTGVAGQANDVAGALDVVGFDVVETGDAAEPVPWPRTTVLYRPGEEQYAQRVARHVTGGTDYRADDTLDTGTVALVTGSDFTSVHDEATPADQVPLPDSPTTSAAPSEASDSAEEESPAPPPTTSTTIGYAVGAPPEGADCD
jgi:LCP family protein required for cell wall assembly